MGNVRNKIPPSPRYYVYKSGISRVVSISRVFAAGSRRLIRQHCCRYLRLSTGRHDAMCRLLVVDDGALACKGRAAEVAPVGLLPCVGGHMPPQPGRGPQVFATDRADTRTPPPRFPRLFSVTRHLGQDIFAVLKEKNSQRFTFSNVFTLRSRDIAMYYLKKC